MDLSTEEANDSLHQQATNFNDNVVGSKARNTVTDVWFQ